MQLYVGEQKPTAENPIKELKDFTKLSLRAGETKTASFTISSADLSIFDESSHSWQERTGNFRGYIGASSTDIKGTIDFIISR